MLRASALIGTVALAIASPARADEPTKKKVAAADKEAQPERTTQMCIDQEIADRLALKRKRRGAVDRLFVKAHRHEISIGGGGRMVHDAVQGLSFDAGGAIDFFVSKVMTIRIDARDLMAVEEIAAETRYTNNVIATAGVAFWIPTGL